MNSSCNPEAMALVSAEPDAPALPEAPLAPDTPAAPLPAAEPALPLTAAAVVPAADAPPLPPADRPVLVALAPAFAGWDVMAAELPAALEVAVIAAGIVDCGIHPARSLAPAVPVAAMLAASEGTALSLHAKTLLSSTTDDSAHTRDESEQYVEWITAPV